jgi:hypothetical protein
MSRHAEPGNVYRQPCRAVQAIRRIMRRRRLPPSAFADKTGTTMSETLLSFEPATGEELWRGTVSNVDQEVAVARRAWPEWAAKPVTFRTETRSISR